MAQGPNYAGPAGALGGYDALQQFVAQRKMEQIQAALAQQKAAQQEFENRVLAMKTQAGATKDYADAQKAMTPTPVQGEYDTIQTVDPATGKPTLYGFNKRTGEKSPTSLGLAPPKEVTPKNPEAGRPMIDPNGQIVTVVPSPDVPGGWVAGDMHYGPTELKPYQAPIQRDPLAQELEQQRIDAAKEAAKPVDLNEQDFHYSMSGNQYIDLGDYPDKGTQNKVVKAAADKGIPVVSQQTAESLRSADNARANLDKILVQVKGNLPRDAQGRVVQGPMNKVGQYFQTNEGLAAFNSWRVAAIQAMQAVAERGMGMRINRAEIELAQQNDIPQITDTYDTAVQRVKNFNALMDSKEQSALKKDRRGMVVPGGVNDTSGSMGPVKLVIGADGKLKIGGG